MSAVKVKRVYCAVCEKAVYPMDMLKAGLFYIIYLLFFEKKEKIFKDFFFFSYFLTRSSLFNFHFSIFFLKYFFSHFNNSFIKFYF